MEEMLMLQALKQDLADAIRGLRRRPASVLTAVLALAIGVGGNLAVFSTIESLVLRPLPLREPSRLVLVWGTSTRLGRQRDVVSGPNFLDFKEGSGHFDSLAAYKNGADSLIVEGKGVAISGLVASPDFFRVLGVEAALGRLFQSQDGREGQTGVAVLSDAFWRRHYGGDPAIVGRQIRMMGRSTEVIGILPPEFRFLRDFDLVEPLSLDALRLQGRMNLNYVLIGRLAPSASPQQAEQGLNALLREISRQDPRMVDWETRVDPLHEVMSEYLRPALVLLLGAGGLTFLIACVNVGGLLLAEGLRRRPELALRAALGASRGRLASLFAAESLLLAVAGGLGGLALGGWLLWLAPFLLPANLPIPGSAEAVRLPEIAMGWSSLFLIVPLILLAAVLFGAAPAVQASRLRLSGWIRGEALGVLANGRMSRPRRLLVVAEVALATVLLAATGLAVRSALNLLEVDLGLDPSRLLTLYFGELNDQEGARRSDYYRRVLTAVEGVSGVVALGLNDYVPLQQEDDFEGFHFEGIPRDGLRRREEWRRVSPGYFRAAGIALKEGRFFLESDDDRAPSVALVNLAMARKHWPGRSPVGQRIVLHDGKYGSTEIVGVVGDVRWRGLDQEAPPVIYVPYQRNPRPIMALFVRGSGPDPRNLIDPVQEAVRSVDPLQPVMGIRSMEGVVSDWLVLPRSVALLLGSVALVALALATLGVYGAMARSAASRVREMGIRLALGADRREVQRGMISFGLRLSLGGVALGVAVCVLLGRTVAPLLYQVEPLDPAGWALSALLVAGASLVASLRPARRLSRVDPMIVLRCA